VKYNFSVTFCSVPCIVVTPGGKSRERIYTHNGSKSVKSGKDVSFGGFVKMVTPPHKPPNFEHFALQKPFYAQITQKS